MAYNLVKPFIDVKTREKTNVLGGAVVTLLFASFRGSENCSVLMVWTILLIVSLCSQLAGGATQVYQS